MKSKRFSVATGRGLRIALLVSMLVIAVSSQIGHQPQEARPFVLAIDVGHSRLRVGATSARGVAEFTFNQRLGRLLFSELLAGQLITPILINPEGEDIGLTERTQIAAGQNAALLVSIHHDSVQPHYLRSWKHGGKTHFYCDRFQGYSLFFSQKNSHWPSSLTFAQILGSQLYRSGFRPTLHHAEPIRGENRTLVDKKHGIYRFDDLLVLKTASMPAVLLECGVIVNRDEETLLNNEVYQKALTLAIQAAVNEFAQQRGQTP